MTDAIEFELPSDGIAEILQEMPIECFEEMPEEMLLDPFDEEISVNTICDPSLLILLQILSCLDHLNVEIHILKVFFNPYKEMTFQVPISKTQISSTSKSSSSSRASSSKENVPLFSRNESVAKKRRLLDKTLSPQKVYNLTDKLV